MSMNYQMQLHLAHKERQKRFQKAAFKAEKIIARKLKRKYVRISGPSVKFIFGCAAKYYDLSYRSLRQSENRDISKYRWLVFYLCKRILNYSYKKIAGAIRFNIHTVFRGIKIFEGLLLTHPTLALDLRAIRMKVNYAYNA